MHRPWMRRVAALLLVLWTSASVGERAVLDHCPQHDPFGAAMAGMAHAGAAEHTPGGHSTKHHCCCLEECGAVSAFALPAAAVGAPSAAVVVTVPRIFPRREIAPARTDTRLPFANGPPHASAA